MSKNAIYYFENTIIPLIQTNCPNIISDMDIMILGSVGLGIDDEISEIDVYSDDLENELIWAERLSAWNTPAWRNFIKEKEKNAVDSGYSPEQFWVWSLWG